MLPIFYQIRVVSRYSDPQLLLKWLKITHIILFNLRPNICKSPLPFNRQIIQFEFSPT